MTKPTHMEDGGREGGKMAKCYYCFWHGSTEDPLLKRQNSYPLFKPDTYTCESWEKCKERLKINRN